jgi:hypothetical protein
VGIALFLIKEEAEEIREVCLILLIVKRNFSVTYGIYSGVRMRLLKSLQFGREERQPSCPLKPSLFATEK